MKTISVGSDFSGVGAFDFAIQRVAEQKGFNVKNIFACDWDKFARQSYLPCDSSGDAPTICQAQRGFREALGHSQHVQEGAARLCRGRCGIILPDNMSQVWMWFVPLPRARGFGQRGACALDPVCCFYMQADQEAKESSVQLVQGRSFGVAISSAASGWSRGSLTIIDIFDMFFFVQARTVGPYFADVWHFQFGLHRGIGIQRQHLCGRGVHQRVAFGDLYSVSFIAHAGGHADANCCVSTIGPCLFGVASDTIPIFSGPGAFRFVAGRARGEEDR